MGFPWAFHENFEAGTKGDFASEVDTTYRLDYPKQADGVEPYRGNYCMRVNCSKSPTDAYVSATVSWAADSTNYLRFAFKVDPNFSVGNDYDTVNIMTLRSASADEGSITLGRLEPAGLVLGLQDAGGVIQSFIKMPVGQWVCIEAQVDVDAGGGNDGSIIVWVGDDRMKLSNLDQAALTGVRFGSYWQLGDFTGNMYFDQVFMDEARLYPDLSPANGNLSFQSVPVFKDGFAFVGPGEILGATLIDAGSGNCTMQIYDTDVLNYAEHQKKEHMAVTVASAVGTSLHSFKVERGCFVDLGGTNPQAILRLGNVGGARRGPPMRAMMRQRPV